MAWIDDLANALGEPPLAETETDALLELARDVAHRVERKNTPLATFLLGAAVARAVAAGEDRGDALGRTRASVNALLPAEG